MNENKKTEIRITYDRAFYLFIAGGIIGVILEGLYTLAVKGTWETHVVSAFLPINPLYSAGAVILYIGNALLGNKSIIAKAAILASISTFLELICGIFLRDKLGMRAWDYSDLFMNYDGLISLGFSFVWASAAAIFCLIAPYLDKLLGKLKGRAMHIVCIVLTILTILDLSLAYASISRWSKRHYEKADGSFAGKLLDKTADDEWMTKRFVEWRFIN